MQDYLKNMKINTEMDCNYDAEGKLLKQNNQSKIGQFNQFEFKHRPSCLCCVLCAI
jgi:hypothetical protein